MKKKELGWIENHIISEALKTVKETCGVILFPA
jgi:hypothetical protein